MDTSAKASGKQDPSKLGRRSIVIYKSYMHKEVSLDPERCSFKTDQKARNHWVSNQVRQLEQFEDVGSPINLTQDETMEEVQNPEEIGRENRYTGRVDPPPNDRGAHAPTRGTTTVIATVGMIIAGVTQPTGPTRLRFGTQ